MEDLKSFRRNWSTKHKELRSLLKSGSTIEESRELFLQLHAALHRSSVSGTQDWSYAEMVFSNLLEDQYRIIPPGSDHSLIWIIWHISRIEDITMNLLVIDGNQIYSSGGWKDKLNSPIHYTGNLITQTDLQALSNGIDPFDLLDYRDAVGIRTRQIINRIEFERLAENVSPSGLDRMLDEGAVLPESEELLFYWGRKKIYQLLLMPPTRHLMVHLNEAHDLRRRIMSK